MGRLVFVRLSHRAIARCSVAGALVVACTIAGWWLLAAPSLAAGPAANITVTFSANPIPAPGGSTTATASVTDASSPGQPVPGETITFSSTDPGETFGTVTDNGDGTYTALVSGDTTAGPVTITATDAAASVSGQATLTQTTGSTTSLTQASQSYVTNENVELVAAVTSSQSNVLPSGAVEFENGGTPINGCSSAGLTKSSDGSVFAVCSTSFPASSPQLTAVFIPDSSSLVTGSTSQPDSLTIGPDSTSAFVTAPSSVLVGANATYTATVTPAHSGPVAPSGTVGFSDNGSPIGLCQAQPLTSAGGSFTATCTVSYGAAGSHSIKAQYNSGDGNFAGSLSSAQSVSVNPIVVQTPTSTTSLLAAINHPPVTNENVTLVATVISDETNVSPTGTLTFESGGKPISGCAGEPLTPYGQSATVLCQTSFPTSTAQLSAVFTPSAGSSIAGSKSPVGTLAIGKDSTSTSLAAPSAPTVGTAAIYTAAIVPSHSGSVSPSGSVQFLDGGAPLSPCLSRPLSSAGGHFTATCTVSYATPGTHSITARYSGDGNFSSSGSSPPQQVSFRKTPVVTLGIITATMEWTFFHTPAYTQVLSMVMNGAPAHATVLLTCRGRGCPFAKSTAAIAAACSPKPKQKCHGPAPGSVNLMPRFRHHRLHVGTRITVEIARPGWIGKYYMFTVRARSGPRIQIGCLGVGGTRPGIGC